MKQYVNLLNKILSEGEERHDRTGVGTLSIFGGDDLLFDLREKFPLVTIKKTLWNAAFIEMLWFISGSTNTKFLKENNIKIWDDWADKDGNLGPVYGSQWRNWPGKIHQFSHTELLDWSSNPSINPLISKVALSKNFIGNKVDKNTKISYEPYNLYQERVDQLKDLINSIISNPTSRRHIVSAWNPGYINEMGLPPCHYLFQCYVSNDKHLDLKLNMRSWDTGLGAPFNIAQYALLTHLIARATNLKPRFLRISYGDAHVYLNHVDLLKQRLDECSIIDCNTKLIIKTDNTDIDGYHPEDFDVEGYEFHPFLKLPIAV